jgi:type IV secretory pathway VirB10-like protein
MSVIQEPGSTRPGRAAGLVLIGIAIIAVVLGVITLINPNEDKPNTAPPNSTQNPPPPSGQPTQSSGPRPSGSTSQPPPPPVTTTTAPPQPPPPFDPKQIPLRVFNNSTIAKAAAQAADDFRADGWQVVEVGNYSESNIPTTTVYFRAGNGEEEAAAKALAAKCQLTVAPRLANFRYEPGVVVMITKDYCGK